MRRSSWTGRIVVYRYGCPGGADLDAAAMAQLRLAHDLRNDLVGIIRRHEAEIAAAWATRPELAGLAAVAADREAVVRSVLEQVRRWKVDERSQSVPSALRDEATQARLALREARAALRGAKQAAFEDLRPLFAASAERMQAERKATYARWVQDRGLYWATYGDVASRFDASVAAMRRRRREGRPASLRFHRFDGAGTLTVQLHREASDGPRSPDVLAEGVSKWRNVIRLPTLPANWDALDRADRRRASRVTVTMRVGRDESGEARWLSVPIVMHRPLPPDADVAQVQVSRRRAAGHYQLTVAVTCRLAATASPAGTEAVVAIDLGWRSLGDGRIRVATLEAAGGLGDFCVPGHVEEFIAFQDGGRRGEVVLPASWTKPFLRLGQLDAQRAENLVALRPEMVAWLEEQPAAGERLGVDSVAVSTWRSPRHWAALARRWRDLRFDGDGEMFDRLESWRSVDRRLWERREHERRQLVDRRRDAWRVLAALLTKHFEVIVVPDIHLPSLSRIPDMESGDDRRDKRSRAQRAAAAPGSLRAYVTQAAAGRGVKVVSIDTRGLSAVHYRCGQDLSGFVDYGAGMWVFCKYCNETFDQDVNTCRRLLGHYQTRGGAGGATGY